MEQDEMKLASEIQWYGFLVAITAGLIYVLLSGTLLLYVKIYEDDSWKMFGGSGGAASSLNRRALFSWLTSDDSLEIRKSKPVFGILVYFWRLMYWLCVSLFVLQMIGYLYVMFDGGVIGGWRFR